MTEARQSDLRARAGDHVVTLSVLPGPSTSTPGNWTKQPVLPVPGRQDQARGRQGRPSSLKLLARDTVNKGSSSLHSRLENQELGRRQSRNYGSDQANPRD